MSVIRSLVIGGHCGMKTIDQERAKYEKAWMIREYADHSPGEEIAELFFEIAQPKIGENIIDLGTGSGKGAIALHGYGLDVSILDLTFNGLVPKAKALDFERVGSALWADWGIRKWDYGYCVDVMEHIPMEYVMLTLKQIVTNCEKVFFHICLQRDGFGKLVGQPLHLTVMPFEWWKAKLSDVGKIIECRDFINNGVYYVGRF